MLAVQRGWQLWCFVTVIVPVLLLLPTPSTHASPTTTTVTSPLDCDFEKDMCGWTTTHSNHFLWERKSAIVPGERSKMYEPSSDHTLENVMGHYLQVSRAATWGSVEVKLISPKLEIPSAGICFKLWYFMNAPSVSPLKVFAKPLKGKNRLVWEKSGSQGADWRFSQIHVQNITGKASLTVEIIVYGSAYENAAVDDFSMSYGACPPTNTCDFEEGTSCSLTQSKSDNLDWSLGAQASQAETKGGPGRDHTFHTGQGHYAMLNTPQQRVVGDEGVLESHQFPAVSSSCLSFWYNMNGTSVGTLNIKLNPSKSSGGSSNNQQILWTKSGNQGEDWMLANVGVSSSVKYRIVFEGIVGSAVGSGQIAIDDIAMRSGVCQSFGSCDFEEDACSWQNDLEGDNFDWRREIGHHNSFERPKTDHTLMTPFGHYLLYNTRTKYSNGKASYVSPPLAKDRIYCLNLWYAIKNKPRFYIVTRDLVTKTEDVGLFNVTGPTSKQWMPVTRTVGPFGKEYNILLYGLAPSSGSGFIAVDDLSIREGSCKSLPAVSQKRNAFQCSNGSLLQQKEVCNFNQDCPNGEEEKFCGYDCTFEDGTSCGWLMPLKDGTTVKAGAWRVESAATAHKEGGPELDHTVKTSSGKFAYEPRSSNKALLVSPQFQRSAPSCEMVFSLFNYNKEKNDFTVVKIVRGVDTVVLPMVATEGSGKDSWQTIIVTVGLTEVPFTIVISKRKVAYSTNDAPRAVDDIFFRNCDFPKPGEECPDKFKCGNEACISLANVCDFEDDCGDASDESEELCSSYHRCDMESGMCDWSQEKHTDYLDWEIGRRHGSKIIGPTLDHTTFSKTGGYLHMGANPYGLLEGDKAWLLSPVIEPTSSCFFTFFLNILGENIERFSVYTRAEIDGNLTRIFTKSGDTANVWSQVYVAVNSKELFQIVLEGVVRGKGNKDYIAVDDLILSPGCNISSASLPLAKPSGTSSVFCGDANRWQCADGSDSIYTVELCDFVSQCSDASDEMDCGACDFETSSCGWKDRTFGKYIWDRVNTTSTAVKIKPKTDHTHNGVGVGSYILVHSKGYGFVRPAIVESPIYGSTEAGCTISFYYYYVRVSSFISLRLHPKEETDYEHNKGIELWHARVESDWTRATVSIGARAAGFRLVFYHHFYGTQITGFIAAIDDISFSSSCGIGKPATSCRLGEFMCTQTTECKPFSSRCDLAEDCKNGEDEKDCGKYLMNDFENGLKDFTNDYIGTTLSWKIQQPSASEYESAPDRDHTYGNETGHYMYIAKSETKSEFSDIARFKGPVMMGNREGTCRMRLFYHLNGNYSKAISVYTETREGGVLNLKWSASAVDGDEWKKADIELVERVNFKVVIEAVRGAGYRGDIGIDDVTFTPQCVKVSGTTSLPPAFPLPRHRACKPDVEFRCDGKCLPLTKWCNFQMDCKDKRDELSCPSHCDFESGLCGWKNEAIDGSTQWKRATASSSYSLDTDHSLGIKEGHVLLSDRTQRGSEFQTNLVSPLFTSSSSNCQFSFWRKRGTALKINIRHSNTERPILHRTWTTKASGWGKATVQLPPCQAKFQLVILLKAKSYDLPIYLDDFMFTDCAIDPPKESCKPGEFHCANGFCVGQDQLCDLSNDCCDDSDEDHAMCSGYKKDTFTFDEGSWKEKAGFDTWTRENYHAKRSGFPDHTTSLSNAEFLTATCNEDDPMVILHEMPTPNKECVVTFWYQIATFFAANLTVIVNPVSSGQAIHAGLFQGPTQPKHVWHKANVTISVGERYELLLQGTCDGFSDSSFLAVDDVVFSPGCNNNRYHPPTTQQATSSPFPTASKNFPLHPKNTSGLFQCVSDGHCIPHSAVCDFNTDCPDQSDERSCNTISTCEFDSGLCGWRENQIDSLDWERVSPSDITAGRGPRLDANGVTGSYVFIKQTPRRNSKYHIASLESRTFSSSAASCTVEFYYFIAGKNPGLLSLRMSYGLSSTAILWETNRTSDKWVKANVWVGRRDYEFRLNFFLEPIVMSSGRYGGQVAVDKISFSSSCKELPSRTPKTCPDGGEYLCQRGACVSKSHVCDGQDDCGDASDEYPNMCKNFTRENFDSSTNPFGNWMHQDFKDKLDWSAWNISQPVPRGLLGVDHSSGLASGQYLFVKGGPAVKPSDAAALVSQTFGPTDGQIACDVSLYAVIPSKHHSLRIGYRTQGQRSPVTYKNVKVTRFGSFWQQVTATFAGLAQPFQVVIEATPGQPEEAVAIDDVTFGPYCRPFMKDPSSAQESSSADWETPVGAVIGVLAAIASVSGFLFYLYRTGKLGELSVRFRRFRDVYSVTSGHHSDSSSSNYVYFDGKNRVNM